MMADRPLTGAVVLDRLAEAHVTLALLPAGQWPTGFVLSGGVVGDVDGSRRRDQPPFARHRPGQVEIAAMEQALGWLQLLPPVPSPIRAAVQLRSLTCPHTSRPRMTWHQIGDRIGCSHTHARTLCMEGVGIIAHRVNGRATSRPQSNVTAIIHAA